MAKLFGKNEKQTNAKGNNLETRYKNSIGNLLVVVIFSVINIVLLLTGTDTYFLFSAFVPYFIVDYGRVMCGMYPEEFYSDLPMEEFLDSSFLIVMVAIAAVIIVAYLVCWVLAKKKKVAALFVSLVLFVADTLLMLYMVGFSADIIIDIIFHIWVIVYLITAISTYYKIKNTPDADCAEMLVESEDEDGNPVESNSSILRMAEEVKSRVFIDAETCGMHIIVRRVKHTNELVINGCVYDEYEGVVEYAHTLTADLCGHRIEAVFDGATSIKLFVDSQEVAKKIRLI